MLFDMVTLQIENQNDTPRECTDNSSKKQQPPRVEILLGQVLSEEVLDWLGKVESSQFS